MMIGASSIGSIYENVIIFIAFLAQLIERKTFNLVVVGLIPTEGTFTEEPSVVEQYVVGSIPTPKF